MARQPLFAGLVVDQDENPVEVAYVGDEPCYVINDSGFRIHIPSEQVDRQVLQLMQEQISGNEGLLAEQAARMLGQEDIFSKALIESQLKNIDKQIENVFNVGIPEEGRAYMGMMGFKIKIDRHGDVIELQQPGTTSSEDE